MRTSVTIFASAAAMVALAACEQKTIVVEQASAGSVAAAGVQAAPQPRPVVRPSSPCAAPAGTGPFEHAPKPISSDKVQMPARAVAEHVRGCAGVRFRIGPDGVPQDVAILADYPYGYGFGESGQSIIESARWAPRDDLAWHYMVINMDPDLHH